MRQARVVAEAELSAKTCALSANRGLSSLASESRPLIFGSARRRRRRGGAYLYPLLPLPYLHPLHPLPTFTPPPLPTFTPPPLHTHTGTDSVTTSTYSTTHHLMKTEVRLDCTSLADVGLCLGWPRCQRLPKPPGDTGALLLSDCELLPLPDFGLLLLFDAWTRKNKNIVEVYLAWGGACRDAECCGAGDSSAA